MEALANASSVSESLVRLQKIIAKLRWGVFVLTLEAGVYVRQMGLADTLTIVRIFGFAGLVGLASALDEYLLRNVQKWSRLGLYGIALGDWLVAVLIWALAPALAIEYPFIYFLPIVVASTCLGVPGGVMLGLLSSIALVVQTRYMLDVGALARTIPWVAAFLISGGIGGYIGQQWESSQRHVEATYRWMAELSAATTMGEVAEVVLRYLQNVVEIRAPGATLGGGAAVALLTADEDGDRCSAYVAKGISPEARARLRLSASDGLLSWSAIEAKPIWVGLDPETSPISLPNVEELADFRSCLVAPMVNEGKLLAMGLAFSKGTLGQNETEDRNVTQFTQQAAVSLRKAMIYAEMERQFGTLATVLEKTRYAGQGEVKEVFQWVVAKARELVGAETVALAILEKQDNLVVASASGLGAQELISRGDPSKISPSDWVIRRKAPLLVTDYPNDHRFSPPEADFEAYRSAVLVPLRIEEEMFGVLAAGSSVRSHFNQNDLLVFITLGQQVSLVLQQARLQAEAQELHEMLRQQTDATQVSDVPVALRATQAARLQGEVDTMMANLRTVSQNEGQQWSDASGREELYRGQVVIFAEELHKLHGVLQGQAKEISDTRQELEQAQDSTVLALVMGLERNHKFLAGSGERVAQLAVALGHKLGCSPQEKRDLYYAGQLRDVGLMGVPPEILLYPDLDENQMELVRQHPMIGQAILSSFPFLAGASQLVRHHHERWDGRGYPDGSADKRIPYGSRILSVADVYEALTAERSYRGPLSPREALETILKRAGSQFDEEICRCFVTVFEERHDVAGWVLPRLGEPS